MWRYLRQGTVHYSNVIILAVQDSSDVRVLNVETMILGTDSMEFVIRMGVITITGGRETKLTLVLDQTLPLTHPSL